MQLREMIESGAIKAGNQTNLAKVIGVHAEVIYAAKAGRRGLPASACFKLAAILGIEEKKVIAASELATEKDEEKRAFFAPFVLNGIAPLASALAVLSLLIAPNESYANDRSFMSSNIMQPMDSKTYENQNNVIGIMRSRHDSTTGGLSVPD
jgi:plasmid maintenance system antidote protein VapI